jgi:signal transduction histidine kinase/DNA-binding NarL/FixJ family response regulator
MSRNSKIIIKIFICLSISAGLTFVFSYFRVMNSNTLIFNMFFVFLVSLVILFFSETKLNSSIELDKKEKDHNRKIEDMKKTAVDLLKERELLEKKVRERTSELEIANEKLKNLDIIKTNFFTNISHEIRTPLTLIMSPLESIINGNYGGQIDKNNEILKIMRNNGLHLLKLINNLLDYTKLETGKMAIHKKNVNIIKLVEHYIESIKPAAMTRELEIKYFCYSDSIIACIDNDLFEIIFFNIISNAFKFTPNSGVITIILEKINNDRFSIEIRDTGIGIPEEKFEYIFDRFSQISDNIIESSGIGLSLVKDIITLHDGEISLESQVEKGSAFKITLPIGITDENDAENIISSGNFKKVDGYILQDLIYEKSFKNKNESSTKKKTVFIVEDNNNMLEFLVEVLTNKFNVITANNGLDALQKLESNNIDIDLILSDVMMPKMNGKDFFNKIKDNERYKDIPLIFLTAKASFEEKIEGLREGAIDYIYKPFSIEELEAKIESIINKKEIIRESYKKEIKNSILNVLDSAKEKPQEKDLTKILSEYNVTHREIEIINLILKGSEYKEISNMLEISINTVNNHIQNIYKKLNIQNRIELINLINRMN